MKKYTLFFLFMTTISLLSYAAEMKYGSLNIFSKMPGVSIYVDGDKKGKDSVLLREVQAGTHFVKVTSGDATPEAVIYAEVVEIEPGEVTTLYITEKGIEETKKQKETAEEVDVFRAKRIIDYSREMHTGWYLKLNYLTNLYYNYESPSLDNYASTFDLGLGFKLPLAPSIDFSLEIDRAQMSSSKATWYFMPLTANIMLSYLPSTYFRGKQYFGLGLGYFMTDLENDSKQNLTTLGYHLFYGLEMPSGDKNAFFFQFGSYVAEISRYNYNLSANYISIGYRWDVLE